MIPKLVLLSRQNLIEWRISKYWRFNRGIADELYWYDSPKCTKICVNKSHFYVKSKYCKLLNLGNIHNCPHIINDRMNSLGMSLFVRRNKMVLGQITLKSNLLNYVPKYNLSE